MTWLIVRVWSMPKKIWATLTDQILCSLWWKPDRTMTWPIRPSAIYDITRQDNNVIDCIGAIYAKNETKLSWSIKSSAIYGENLIGQWCDRLYSSGLHWKWNWIIMIDQTGYRLWWKQDRTSTWLILQMWSTSKTKLSCLDGSDIVWSVMKTR